MTENKFQVLLEALITYKSEYGDLNVPSQFYVPKDSVWPSSCWNMPLGRKVMDLRSRRIFNTAKAHEKLEEIGFQWGSPRVNCLDQACEALTAYRSLYGDLNVPRCYIVPCDDSFPEKCWGLKLGNFCNNVRYRGDYISADARVRVRLETIGLKLDYDEFDTRHWAHIYYALTVYKKLYGHLNVPKSWAVPVDASWPKCLWGLKLGYRCNNIRYRGDFVTDNPQYKALLDDIGFLWKKGKFYARKG
eukprot:CAMPEP_0182422228 /NCGR_PEP_ID=MMETSP1167-20130531/7847_1 /TAXON_ID=2988 /ORGANISM="Mallomonas Sp, Strain CCMP3275" /LENGTH=245 /DNA_ID=CAMNT_0024600081 /DNA_START=405 /DNA_END=1142 /DNA_ORIENTATION=+